jgi:hypothetical protein
MSTTAVALEREILDAVRGIRFGSVEVVIHDSKVVQVIRTEKVRVETSSTTASPARRPTR